MRRIYDRTENAGSALIMVVVLSAIIYLAITLLLLLVAVETQVSYSEQRSMQAFFSAESTLAFSHANLRALNGEFVPMHDVMQLADDWALYRNNVIPQQAIYHYKTFAYVTLVGANGMTQRGVGQDIIVKPFALFAAGDLSLTDGVTIKRFSENIGANIHGEQRVSLARGVSVEGNVTFGASLDCPGLKMAQEGELACPENPILGKIRRAPTIPFPSIKTAIYTPTYRYHGKEYQAEALGAPTIVALEKNGETEPPATAIHVYARRPNLTMNPAGVFFADSVINDETTNTLTNLDIEGTLILQGSAPWKMKGILKIEAVENFPAILSFSSNSLDLHYLPFENIEQFLPKGGQGHNMNTTNHISGLIYSKGDVTLISDGAGGELVKGSVFAQNITITATPQFIMRYNLRVLTDSPPGLSLLDTMNWCEYIGDDLDNLIKQLP